MSLHEPSMEDILASIRRIIAEDQSNNLARGSLAGLTRRPAPPVVPEPVSDAPPASALDEGPGEAQALRSDDHGALPDASVLHEPDATAPDEAAVPGGHAVEAGLPYHAEPEPEFVTDGDDMDNAFALHGLPASADEIEPLVSDTAGASITSSFHALAESVVLQDPDLVERVMRESMRPLLKAWLDDHLPSIVERLVRVEIERVARGGRGRNS